VNKLHLLFILAFLLPSTASAFTKEIGKGYCSIRHPIEAISSSRTACESQHVIQRNKGGGNDLNTIWINTTLHDYLDRYKGKDGNQGKPWETERPWAGKLGDNNLNSAYMMGTYANGYHFMIYDHHRGGMPTLIEWDGVSHLTYMVGSVMNFITKEMSYIGFQMDKGSKNKETQYTDAIIGVFIDFIEVVFGLIYGVFGIIIGTIMNPLDTLTNIPGGVLLCIETTIEGIANTISDIISLFTLGHIEL
jgi:hypothetical protein